MPGPHIFYLSKSSWIVWSIYTKTSICQRCVKESHEGNTFFNKLARQFINVQSLTEDILSKLIQVLIEKNFYYVSKVWSDIITMNRIESWTNYCLVKWLLAIVLGFLLFCFYLTGQICKWIFLASVLPKLYEF